jgi:ribosome-binding protein aMBF1 (putative translation factor)
MEKCMRCSRSEEEVRIFDGIYVSEPVKICEKCSLMAGIPIIKRPNLNQLKASEKPMGVRERLMLLNKIDVPQKKVPDVFEEIKNLETKPELEKPEHVKFKLVDNFHWDIQTHRRRRGLNLIQLAEKVGESEAAIKLMEKGIIPEDGLRLAQKLEQFLNIKIIKKAPEQVIFEETQKSIASVSVPFKGEIYKTRMRKEEGEDMLQEAILSEKNPEILKHEEVDGVPLKALDFSRAKKVNPSIADLKIIHDRIEKDFDQNKDSRVNLAQEQVEDFGREDIDYLKKKVYKTQDNTGKSKVPTIYDLMKKKEEKDKGMIGKDIELE